MGNVLDNDKQQQILALGRLGWSLRRIEQAFPGFAERLQGRTALSYLLIDPFERHALRFERLRLSILLFSPLIVLEVARQWARQFSRERDIASSLGPIEFCL